jgi:hypothetical protein
MTGCAWCSGGHSDTAMQHRERRGRAVSSPHREGTAAAQTSGATAVVVLPVTLAVLLLPAAAIAWQLSPRNGVASPVLFSAAR